MNNSRTSNKQGLKNSRANNKHVLKRSATMGDRNAVHSFKNLTCKSFILPFFFIDWIADCISLGLVREKLEIIL